VRFIDGSYHIAKIDLTQIGEIPYDEVEYIGHDVDGHNFMMIEAWDSQCDELLEGMETLVPAWSAFAGFTKKI
jgi:CRISPR type III-associated protein (TIGR04423 family)